MRGKYISRFDFWLCGCAIATLLFSILYLQCPFKWWYEDDPSFFFIINKITNPSSIFLNPVVMKSVGSGANIVPMQVFSYWLDVKLFGVSPFAAYAHSVLTFVIVSVMLYIVLQRFTGDSRASFFITLLWSCMPSTVAVHYFISTRHYMEGLGWSLLACYWVHRICNSSEKEQNLNGFLILVFSTFAAMLSKEIYVTTLPAFLFIYAFYKRRYWLSFLAVIEAYLYTLYWLWMSTGKKYPATFLKGLSYFNYLEIMPFTFAAGTLGYIIYGCFFALCIFIAWKRRSELWVILFLVALLASALLALYPTASALLVSYKVPGTWYRASFIVNSLILVFFGYLLITVTSRRTQIIALTISSLVIFTGTVRTKDYWTDRMQAAEMEGKFYLSNPDKLLLSMQDAYWFIPGVHDLYKVTSRHYINKNTIKGVSDKRTLSEFNTLYKYEAGKMVKDDDMYNKLKFLMN